MAKYEHEAQNLAARIANAVHEKHEEDQALAATAKEQVGDLQEFAADLTTALKNTAPKLTITINGTPWKRYGDEMVSTLEIEIANGRRAVRVALNRSGNVIVDGNTVSGSGTMVAIENAVFHVVRSMA